MDLWRLHIFCRVIEKKSFSKAANSIHLSQPTISSHIKDLEDHFKCRLIDRLTKTVVPTKAGWLLYDYACRLIALKDEAESALSEFQGTVSGRLMIGGSTIPGGYVLPKIIGAFNREYPEAIICLKISDTKAILKDIVSGKLELGIVGAPTRDPAVFQEQVMKDQMRLIVPADHKYAAERSITLGMLMKEPFISRESGSGTLESIRKSMDLKGYRDGDLNIVAEMGNTTAVIQGIKSRMGVSILSTIAVSEELERGSLKAVAIKDLPLDRYLYLTGLRDRTPSPLSRTFIRFIKKDTGY